MQHVVNAESAPGVWAHANMHPDCLPFYMYITIYKVERKIKNG